MKLNIIISLFIIIMFIIINTSIKEKANTNQYEDWNLKINKKTRNLQMTEKNKTNSSIYNIIITELNFHDKNKINFTICSQPDIIKNISLILELEINKLNESQQVINSEKIDINIIINNDTDKYTTILENFNITGIKEIKIENAILENEEDDIYNIYFPKEKLVIINETGNYIINYTLIASENNSNNDIKINNTNESSDEKISIGIIVAIIIGGILLIFIIIIILICCRKRSKKNIEESYENNYDNLHSRTSISISNDNNNTNYIIVDEPKPNMRTFSFESKNQDVITITIESNKNLKELRRLYFEKIERSDLFEDDKIYFEYDGKPITRNSEGVIEYLFRDYKEIYKIFVIDEENQIK